MSDYSYSSSGSTVETSSSKMESIASLSPHPSEQKFEIENENNQKQSEMPLIDPPAIQENVKGTFLQPEKIPEMNKNEDEKDKITDKKETKEESSNPKSSHDKSEALESLQSNKKSSEKDSIDQKSLVSLVIPQNKDEEVNQDEKQASEGVKKAISEEEKENNDIVSLQSLQQPENRDDSSNSKSKELDLQSLRSLVQSTKKDESGISLSSHSSRKPKSHKESKDAGSLYSLERGGSKSSKKHKKQSAAPLNIEANSLHSLGNIPVLHQEVPNLEKKSVVKDNDFSYTSESLYTSKSSKIPGNDCISLKSLAKPIKIEQPVHEELFVNSQKSQHTYDSDLYYSTETYSSSSHSKKREKKGVSAPELEKTQSIVDRQKANDTSNNENNEPVKIITESKIIDLNQQKSESNDKVSSYSDTSSINMISNDWMEDANKMPDNFNSSDALANRQALEKRIMDNRSIRSRIMNDDSFESDSIQQIISTPKDDRPPQYDLEYKDIVDETAKAIIIRYRVQMQKYDDKISDNRKTIKSLKNTIRENKAKKMQTEEEKAKLEQEQKELEQSAETNKSEIDLAKDELKKLKEQMMVKDEKIKKQRAEIKALERSAAGIKSMEVAIPDLQKINQVLTSDVERLTQKVEREKRRGENAFAKFNELSDHITEIEMKTSERLSTLEKHSIILEKIEILRGKSRKLRTENKALSMKLAEFPTSKSSPKAVAQTKEEVDQSKTLIADYDEKISEQLTEISALRREIKRMEAKANKTPKSFTEVRPYNKSKEEIMKESRKERTPLYKPRPLIHRSNEIGNDYQTPSLHSSRANVLV